MMKEMLDLEGVDKLSLFVNGGEELRVVFATEDQDPEYWVSGGEAMYSVDRDEFILALEKYEQVCMGSWDYTLKQDYLLMENVLAYEIDLGN